MAWEEEGVEEEGLGGRGVEARNRVERCLGGGGGCIDWSPHQILAGISKHWQRGAGKTHHKIIGPPTNDQIYKNSTFQ